MLPGLNVVGFLGKVHHLKNYICISSRFNCYDGLLQEVVVVSKSWDTNWRSLPTLPGCGCWRWSGAPSACSTSGCNSIKKSQRVRQIRTLSLFMWVDVQLLKTQVKRNLKSFGKFWVGGYLKLLNNSWSPIIVCTTSIISLTMCN